LGAAWDQGDDSEDTDGGTGTTGVFEEVLGGDGDFGEAQSMEVEESIDSFGEGRGKERTVSQNPSDVSPLSPSAVRPKKQERSAIPGRLRQQMGLMPVVHPGQVYGKQGKSLLRGYLAIPENPLPGKPGVVLIHDWWGLRPWVKLQADRLAQVGFTVLAVDLYGGEHTQSRKAAEQLTRRAEKKHTASLDNLRQALLRLRKRGCQRVATMGWSFGGGFALQAAVRYPKLVDAVVTYYGHVILRSQSLRRLDAPLLGIFAELDKGVPVKRVRTFRNLLRKLGKTHALKLYAHAAHAFASPPPSAIRGPDYRFRVKDAKDAWKQTLNFLRLYLVREE
jgi:carboxymethylenebutenolidase